MRVCVEIADDPEKCVYRDGDYWGSTVCQFHTHMDGNGKIQAPRCILFREWLEGEVIKCEKCKEATIK